MQIIDSWLSDLPQQFLDKERIYTVIEAFSKQLQDIQFVFNDLNKITDIDNAVGQNLDMVGNIVSLTRKDATAIIRKANDDVLTDDIYRQTLRYKILKNSSDCTYEDIMGAVSLLWDTSNIVYKEPRERPATVLLSIPTVNLDSIDPTVGRVLAIKSSGVAIIYTVGYWGVIPLYLYEKISLCSIDNNTEIILEQSVNSRADIRTEIYCKENILCSLVTKKNIWHLNGSQLLDGNRYLNAIEIKEVV